MKSLFPLVSIPLAAITQTVYAVEYFTPEQAQVALFGHEAKFQASFIKLSDDQRDAIEDMSDVRQRWKTQKVWKVHKNGKFSGWFIIDRVIGKHEFITYATALSAEGKVLGIEVMDYRETYGDEIRRDSWRNHFVGATRNSPLELEEDIPNISGATLSCRNVTNGVKRLLAMHSLILSKIDS